jgi:hypothetical protein
MSSILNRAIIRGVMLGGCWPGAVLGGGLGSEASLAISSKIREGVMAFLSILNLISVTCP